MSIKRYWPALLYALVIPLTWFDTWFYGILADIGAVPVRIPEIFYTVQNLWEMTLVIGAIYIGKRLANRV